MHFEIKTDKEQIREEREKKDKLIIVFALLILFLAIAYGTITRKLIATTPTSNSSIWNISYSNIDTVYTSGEAHNIQEPSIENTAVFINAGFGLVNDAITYEITISNNGTIDATLQSIYVFNPDYSVYDYEFEGIEEGEILKSGRSKKFKLTIRVKSIDKQIKKNFFINLNYVQS